MPRLCVLVVDPLSEEAISEIDRVADVRYCPAADEATVLGHLPTADVLVLRSGHRVTEDWLDRATSLRAIIRAGSGTDNIPVEAALGRGLLFANLPEANVVSVAELGIASIFILLRNLFPAFTQLREGTWAKAEHTGFELQGKTVALIGFGRIGQAMATRLQAFGVDLIAVRRSQVPLAGWEHIRFTTLDEACEQANVICVQVPLTQETRNLLGSGQFRAMKKRPVLVNLARYEVVDMEALREAVRREEVRAALIDPVSKEQASAGQRDGAPIYFLPHLGASTFDAQRRIGILIRERLAAWGLAEGVPGLP